ncbi:MAG TPA: hypothetical protein VMF69_15935 [Gemmataceae bacterium]|nr:hypothetical protein [Gemmataceae bacterium]
MDIVEFEQAGKARVEYGEALIQRLAQDLDAKAEPANRQTPHKGRDGKSR